jgi:ComF family protein
MGWLAELERWLLPEECLLCRASPSDGLICRLCRCRWQRLPAPFCTRCGQPRLLTDLDCRLCAGWPEVPERVRSAVWHQDGARDAVHQLKYEGWWKVTDAMADPMAGLEPLTGRLLLVPVPLAGKRLKSRGYNQSEYLARALGKRCGIPVNPAALRRIRETPTQTALTPEERLANVSGAFRGQGVKGIRVVLVDDVFTTGATLVAAATALKQAGAAQVEAVTFARAKPAIGNANH